MRSVTNYTDPSSVGTSAAAGAPDAAGRGRRREIYLYLQKHPEIAAAIKARVLTYGFCEVLRRCIEYGSVDDQSFGQLRHWNSFRSPAFAGISPSTVARALKVWCGEDPKRPFPPVMTRKVATPGDYPITRDGEIKAEFKAEPGEHPGYIYTFAPPERFALPPRPTRKSKTQQQEQSAPQAPTRPAWLADVEVLRGGGGVVRDSASDPVQGNLPPVPLSSPVAVVAAGAGDAEARASFAELCRLYPCKVNTAAAWDKWKTLQPSIAAAVLSSVEERTDRGGCWDASAPSFNPNLVPYLVNYISDSKWLAPTTMGELMADRYAGRPEHQSGPVVPDVFGTVEVSRDRRWEQEQEQARRDRETERAAEEQAKREREAARAAERQALEAEENKRREAQAEERAAIQAEIGALETERAGINQRLQDNGVAIGRLSAAIEPTPELAAERATLKAQLSALQERIKAAKIRYGQVGLPCR